VERLAVVLAAGCAIAAENPCRFVLGRRESQRLSRPGPASFWCACVDRVPQVSVADSRGPAGYGNCPDVTRGVLAAQEDAVDYKLSVFRLFAELFPEFTNSGLGIFVESLCACSIATAPRTDACAPALGLSDVISHFPRKHAQARASTRKHAQARASTRKHQQAGA
jgi:hypothetical protein